MIEVTNAITKEQIDEDFLKFAKVRPSAKIPTKNIENAGFDIYADFSEDYIFIPPLSTKLIPTGIASAMSSDLYLQVEERGSTGSKGIKKSAGIIDSSYRGEIFVAITNANNNDLYIYNGELEKAIKRIEEDEYLYEIDSIFYPASKAIAQLILHRVHNEVPVSEISFEELKNIPSSRGEGKLGSSGK